MQRIVSIPKKHIISIVGYSVFILGLLLYTIGVLLSYVATYSWDPNLAFFTIIFYVCYITSFLFVCLGGGTGFVFFLFLFWERAEYKKFILMIGIFGWILVGISLVLVILAFIGRLWGYGVGYGIWVFLIGFGTGLVMIIYLYVLKPTSASPVSLEGHESVPEGNDQTEIQEDSLE